MAKKVGIPKGLFYYKYYPFWKRFLEELGYEVVTSGHTTQKILQNGIRHTIDETCLSVKVFCGHVLDLVDRGVDYLFIPRIESVERGHFVCAKALGLPDIVRNCIPLTSEMSKAILTPNIDSNRRFLYQSMFSVGWRLTKNPIRIHRAYGQAKKRQQNFEETLTFLSTPQEVIELIEGGGISYGDLTCSKNKAPKTPPDPQTHLSSNAVTIALIGHPYNIYDNFINQGIIEKLQGLGINIITQEMAPQKVILKLASEASKDLYWTDEKEILGASLYFVKKGVDGIIFLISFPCGPDSLTIEFAIRQIKGKVPILSLVIDEHHSRTGIITRLESFIDVVKMRRRK